MKLFTISILLPLALIGGGMRAFADDRTPNLIITGTVTTDACAVGTDSQKLNVPMGDILSGLFTQVGDVSPKKEFVITLTDCDEGVAGATITFTGTSDSDNPDLLQITKDTGSATGVGVEVIDETTGESIPLGKATAVKSLSTSDNNLPYQLRYKSTLGTVTAGSADAVMYFDLAYQ